MLQCIIQLAAAIQNLYTHTHIYTHTCMHTHTHNFQRAHINGEGMLQLSAHHFYWFVALSVFNVLADLPTPKYFCQYSEQPVSVFSDFWVDFLGVGGLDARPISQSKKSVKGQFFYHSSCKNSVWTHIFNYTHTVQNWHTMTLRRLYFVYIC